MLILSSGITLKLPVFNDKQTVSPTFSSDFVSYKLSLLKIKNTSLKTFNVGFNRAGKLLNQLIKDGIISADEGLSSKGKEVIIHSEAEYNDKVLDSEII